MTFLKLLLLCVTSVSDIYLLLLIFTPFTKSPEVIPVAQKIESPVTISFKSYFLLSSLIPIFSALEISFSSLNINLP